MIESTFNQLFLSKYCRPNPNCHDKIDSNGPEIHQKVQIGSKEFKNILKLMERDQKKLIYKIFLNRN